MPFFFVAYRDLLTSLTLRLNNVEEAVFLSTNRSTPIPSHDRSHTHHLRASKPMTIGDLNLSPIGSSTKKPRPPLGGEGSGSNPLHSAPFRPGNQAGAKEGCGKEEECDLVSHTLSGHSLSCSLELMSDIDGEL